MTVCVARVLVDIATEDAKMFEVSAAVMAGRLEDEDAVVELA